MPAKYHNTSAILPPSMQQGNYIHDAGNKATAALDHDGIGEGCHCPGGLYSDEGTVNRPLAAASSDWAVFLTPTALFADEHEHHEQCGRERADLAAGLSAWLSVDRAELPGLQLV